MPRNLLHLPSFTRGIVMSADERDIPDDAATWSVDIDPEGAEGTLRGRYADTFYPSAGDPGSPTGAKSAAFIHRDSATWDLVYHDEWNDKFKICKDFYGTPSVVEMGDADDGEEVQIIPYNREVRLGRSGGRRTKWLGYCEEEQLGVPGNTTTPILENAEIDNPTGIPLLDHLVVDDQYAYGFVSGDTYIYVINRDTRDVASVLGGPTQFTNLAGICVSDKDPLQFYVYDNDGDNNGSVYLINKETHATPLDIGARRNIGVHSGNTPPANAYIASMVATNNGGTETLWFAYHRDPQQWSEAPLHERQYLLVFSCDTTGSGALTPVDRSPQIWDNAGAPVAGDWAWVSYDAGTSISSVLTGSGNPIWRQWANPVDIPESRLSGDTNLIAETFPNSLVKLSATQVGWVARYTPLVIDKMVFKPFDSGRRWAGPYYKKSSGYESSTLHMIFLSGSTSGPRLTSFLKIVDGFEGQASLTGLKYIVSSDGGNVYQLGMTSGQHLYRYRITGGIAPSTAVGSVQSVDSPSQPGNVTRYPIPLPYEFRLLDYYVDGTAAHWALSAKTGYSSLIGVPVAWTVDSVFDNYYDGGKLSLSVTNDDKGEGFDKNKRYFYKVSFVFDGVQESPLSQTFWTVDNGDVTFNKNVVVKIASGAVLNRRATAVNVYRAEGVYKGLKPDGYYRLVKSIPLTADMFGLVGDSYQHWLYDDSQEGGASYEARTGLSEGLRTTFADYEISTVLNGSLFIARCTHDELPDADHMIFKSKEYRFDSFDWASSYLRLPEIPTALCSFNGRLFAFSGRAIYRINPEGMFVEEVMTGAGCMDRTSLVQTDLGIFFADSTSIYLCDGNQVINIGLPVKEAMTYPGMGWDILNHYWWNPKLVYSPKHHMVMAFISPAPGSVWAYCYHIFNKRWDVWTFPNIPTMSENRAFTPYIGKDGEVYYSTYQTNTLVCGDPDDRREWEWYSKRFDFGMPNQTKKIYAVQNQGNNAFISYSLDDSSWITASVTGVLANADRIKKNIRIRVVGASGFSEIKTMAVIWRPMIGLR